MIRVQRKHGFYGVGQLLLAWLVLATGSTWAQSPWLRVDAQVDFRSEEIGRIVEIGPDVDGDGSAEFLIGAGVNSGARVDCHSGTTGAILYSVVGGPNHTDGFGRSLC